MQVQCPRCPDQTIGLRKGVCPGCGYTLTLDNLWREGWKGLRALGRSDREGVKRGTRPESGSKPPAPAPGGPDPDFQRPATAQPVTQRVWITGVHLVRRVAGLPRPALIVLLNLPLLLVGFVSFILLLSHARHHLSERWIPELGLVLLYVAMLFLIIRWVVPQYALARFFWRGFALFKVGLLFCFLASLLLLRLLVSMYWTEALMLAGLLLVALAGYWLFRAFLAPLVLGRPTHDGPTPHDPGDPQGRRGRMD